MKKFVNISLHSIRCCPFCAASGHLIFSGLNPVKYGVKCRSCGVNLPAICNQPQDAIRAWNRRSGLATLGGRATRGLKSRRKLASARRNLKKARQWKHIRQKIETACAMLNPIREQQLAEAEATAAETRIEVAILKQKVEKDLILRRLHALLSQGNEPAIPSPITANLIEEFRSYEK